MNADRMECPHSGLACVSGVSLVCWLACQWCVSVVCWLAYVSGVLAGLSVVCVSGVLAGLCQWCVLAGLCQWCVCWLVSCMLDGLCQWCTGWLVSGVCQWCVSVVCWLACVRGVLAVNCQSVGIIGKAEIVAQLALAGAGDDKCQ